MCPSTFLEEHLSCLLSPPTRTHACAKRKGFTYVTFQCAFCSKGMCGKWHLGTDEYHPTNHGFDYYYGAHMTQNECVSNIVSPGAALVAGVNVRNSSGTKYGSIYGACPIFNGSTAVPSIQRNMLATPPRLFDMNDVDELYDEASLPDNSVTHPPYFYDGRVCLTALRHTPALPLRRACLSGNQETPATPPFVTVVPRICSSTRALSVRWPAALALALC